MTETALLYFPDASEAAAARRTLVILKLRVRDVPPEHAGWTVGKLAGLSGHEETDENAAAPKDAAIVFCGLGQRRLDQTLAALRRAGVPRSVFKAVLTADNADWSFAALCGELAKERDAIDSGGAPVHAAPADAPSQDAPEETK